LYKTNSYFWIMTARALSNPLHKSSKLTIIVEFCSPLSKIAILFVYRWQTEGFVFRYWHEFRFNSDMTKAFECKETHNRVLLYCNL
jgi:hypothetical protein